MEETTEPIIAVIGHPIAGNPTQFALETGLQSVGLDCRVLSFDLNQDQIAPAIIGMKAMNFKAIWVANSCQTSVRLAIQTTLESDAGERIHSVDLLDLGAASDTGSRVIEYAGWKVRSLKLEVGLNLVSNTTPNAPFGKVLFINDSEAKTVDGADENENRLQKRLDWLARSGCECVQAMTSACVEVSIEFPSSVQLERMQSDLGDGDRLLIVIESLGSDCVAARSSLYLGERVCVIDLSEDWDPKRINGFDRIKNHSSGPVISAADLHASCLSVLVNRLFDVGVPVEVFQDAIDEYLAV